MRIADFDADHRFAQVNGIRMHYVERGAGEGRPLVLLLHGFPELWWSWRFQIEPLVEAGFHVVAPDLRGYSETDRTPPYDVDTLVADVCALIDHLGEKKAIVVGHDWGGAVAWHLAATRPEHCERLVVMNCPHVVMMQRALLSKWSQIKRSWYMFFFLVPKLPERLLVRDRASIVARMFRGAAVDKSRFGREDLEPYREAMLLPGAAHAAVEWYRVALRKGLSREERNRAYPVIAAPTMLVWAMDDVALGYDDLVPGTERFVSSLRIERIDRCGHFVQTEAPERVNPLLLDFVRS